jgi:hypothetical protein
MNENKQIALRVLQEVSVSSGTEKSDAIALAQVYATLYLAEQIEQIEELSQVRGE